MTTRHRKALLLFTLVVAGLAGASLLRRSLGIELDPRSLRDFASGLGAIGPVVFVALIVFRGVLGIPSAVALIAAGLCFGVLAGSLYGAVGLTLSALGTFLLARYAGRDAVESRLPDRLRFLFTRTGTRLAASLVALGTAYPIGAPSVIHALAGVTPMPLASFGVAVAAGSGVRAAIYAGFGNAIIAGGLAGLLWASLALTALIVLPLIFPGSRAWLRRLLMTSPEPAD